MRNLTIAAALLVLTLGQVRAQITTYRDTLPDGTITVMVDSGQPPIEVIIDSIFGGLNFAQVSTGLLMDRTIQYPVPPNPKPGTFTS
ncbi:MAG: hypothetical protein SF053_05000 [Bacteroidia bacterium]|nr:hypothetical protein [Bacteroidia bacterium]